MAQRGGTDYAKWASFDDEDDDPLAKLTINTERRHPSLPKVVRKRPEAPRSAAREVGRPRSAGRGRKAPTEPAAPRPELPQVRDGPTPAVAPELAPLKATYAIELLCDPN